MARLSAGSFWWVRALAALAGAWLAAGCGDNEKDEEGDVGLPAAACLADMASIDGPRHYVYSVAWSPIDDFALAGTDGEIRLLRVDPEAPALEAVAEVAERPMAAVVKWSADGRFAVTAGKELKLLSVSREPPALTPIADFRANDGTIFGMDWSLDGEHVITGEEGGAVRVFAVDPEAGGLTQLAEFYGSPGKVFAVGWSPDGRHAAAVGEDGSVRVLEVDTEAEPVSIREIAVEYDTDVQNAVSWSPSGDRLLSGTWWERHAVAIWAVDLEAGSLELQGESVHPTGIVLLAWSRDGERIATAGHDDTLRLSRFDGSSLASMGELEGHDTGIHSASWSTDERFMIMASSMIDRISLIDMRGCQGAEPAAGE